jgi:hypothetical protein
MILGNRGLGRVVSWRTWSVNRRKLLGIGGEEVRIEPVGPMVQGWMSLSLSWME